MMLRAAAPMIDRDHSRAGRVLRDVPRRLSQPRSELHDDSRLGPQMRAQSSHRAGAQPAVLTGRDGCVALWIRKQFRKLVKSHTASYVVTGRQLIAGTRNAPAHQLSTRTYLHYGCANRVVDSHAHFSAGDVFHDL